MIGILREFVRVFSSYRRWHAGVIARSGGGQRERRSERAPTRVVPRRATVIDLAGARRLRCLSEPCADISLAVALLRAQRYGQGRDPRLDTSR